MIKLIVILIRINYDDCNNTDDEDINNEKYEYSKIKL